MYLLYLDESGSVPDPSQAYFVLAGIAIPENSIYWLGSQINNLATEIDANNPDIVEFHASEIFQGKVPPWDKIKKPDRIEVIKKILCILDKAHEDTVIFANAIYKADFPQNDPMEQAFEDLCSRFDIFLQRQYRVTESDQKGIIVLDKSSYEKSLQRLAQIFQQSGTRWRALNNIIDVPLFVDSKMSRFIQLADCIAYAIFRRYNANDLNYFNCIENRFHGGDEYHGLAHKHPSKPNCTCPACLARRSQQQKLV